MFCCIFLTLRKLLRRGNALSLMSALLKASSSAGCPALMWFTKMVQSSLATTSQMHLPGRTMRVEWPNVLDMKATCSFITTSVPKLNMLFLSLAGKLSTTVSLGTPSLATSLTAALSGFALRDTRGEAPASTVMRLEFVRVGVAWAASERWEVRWRAAYTRHTRCMNLPDSCASDASTDRTFASGTRATDVGSTATADQRVGLMLMSAEAPTNW
mmetsp:Transcript_14316/g.56339  ORF Transcript_14316/g.56339 Transcript_14316/m.56339 type:complete len:214 (-) Transcript_14316:1301-1942(-)